MGLQGEVACGLDGGRLRPAVLYCAGLCGTGPRRMPAVLHWRDASLQLRVADARPRGACLPRYSTDPTTRLTTSSTARLTTRKDHSLNTTVVEERL